MNAPLSRQALRAPEHQAVAAPVRVHTPVLPMRAAAAAPGGLRVSSPHDAAEHEASRVARQVVSLPPAPVSASSARLAGLVPSRAASAMRSVPGSAAPARASPAIAGLPTGGQPLPGSLRDFMEPRFGADFSAVRIHTGPQAAQASRQLNAAAFTVGHQIFFGAGAYQPESSAGRELIAHELTHTVQQGAAPQAEPQARRSLLPAISEHSAPAVQRLGIGDALDYFAEHANFLPGFRMFTLVLGVNPINMRPVDRSAGNLLRAVVELMPGGALITQALDNHGIIDRVAGWVQQQLASLGMVGSSIRQAINRFLDSLGWRDIFRLGDVWDRARRIVTEPIARIRSFVGNLVSGILQFIRNAVLRPLAQLASRTRGWDLLCAVLGRNPITGEPVARSAANLIGGFMRLIGQEEVWQNIQRGNAVGRAWAWFQGTLAGLMGFVTALPGQFMAVLRSLSIGDLVRLPQTFVRVAGVFGSFALSFFSWAGQQVMRLLEIIFEVVAPSVMPYLRRAAGALRTIIGDPIRFIGNLVRAAVQGLRQFAGRFLTHLRASLIGWLTGAMSGANIYIPQAFSLTEILKFVLSVLGLTWQNIRGKLARVIGEPAVGALETGFDIVVTLVRDGPAAAWQQIQEGIGNLRDMVMEQVMTFVRDNIVTAAITRLVSSLNPAGAFIQAIIAIYNTVMFFIERMRQIAQVAGAVIDSIAAIASGGIGAAANRVEQTMAGLLTLVISFLARLVGLGRVSDAVTNIINRIRAPIDRALDRVVSWIVSVGRRFLARDPSPTSTMRAPVLAALTRELQADHSMAQADAILRRVADQFRPQGIRRLFLRPPDAEGNVRIGAETNPTDDLAVLRPRRAVPAGRTVRANIELTLRPGAPVVLPTLAATGTPIGATPEGPLQSRDRSPRSFHQLDSPDTAAGTRSTGGRPIGGIVLAPIGQRVQMITWNTSTLAFDRRGNDSHAERQFDHWLDQMRAAEEGRAFLARVSRVEMHLRDYSPCGMCLSMLPGTRRKFPNLDGADLYWYRLYPGLADPTTWSGLNGLAGWRLHAPGTAMPPEENVQGVPVYLTNLPR